jgi:predicted nucleotidyltransferase
LRIHRENGFLTPIFPLKDGLENALSRPVDVISENGIFHYLRQPILEEAKPL